MAFHCGGMYAELILRNDRMAGSVGLMLEGLAISCAFLGLHTSTEGYWPKAVMPVASCRAAMQASLAKASIPFTKRSIVALVSPVSSYSSPISSCTSPACLPARKIGY